MAHCGTAFWQSHLRTWTLTCWHTKMHAGERGVTLWNSPCILLKMDYVIGFKTKCYPFTVIDKSYCPNIYFVMLWPFNIWLLCYLLAKYFLTEGFLVYKDKLGDGTPQWEFLGDWILQLVFSQSSRDLLTALGVSRVSSINWTLAL